MYLCLRYMMLVSLNCWLLHRLPTKRDPLTAILKAKLLAYGWLSLRRQIACSPTGSLQATVISSQKQQSSSHPLCLWYLKTFQNVSTVCNLFPSSWVSLGRCARFPRTSDFCLKLAHPMTRSGRLPADLLFSGFSTCSMFAMGFPLQDFQSFNISTFLIP